MKSSRAFALFSGCVVVTGLISGCGGAAAPSNAVLRVGVSAAIDSLNPFVSGSDYSSVAYQYIYPHLTEYDTTDLSLKPSFATKWETSPDGLTWTFDTVANAEWSDGKPLTAKDAAFTLNTIHQFEDGPTGKLAGFVRSLTTAQAQGDNKLVVTYSEPIANVLAQLQQVPILPEHIWSQYAGGDGKAISTFQNDAPIVSGGPFELQKYQKDQLALFDRNPKWWGPTKSVIDGFGLQFFANSDAMVTALRTGQVDMIGESTPATTVPSLKEAGQEVGTGPGTGFYELIINTNPKKKNHPELLNPEVRKAFEYAMDRKEMLDTAWLGMGTTASTIIAPATGWHDNSITALPFDIGKANAILDGLGYTRGPDGIRVAAGVPMNYEVIFPNEIDGAGDRMFQIMQNDLREAGVGVAMRKMDTDAATAAIAGPDNTYDDFDLAMWDWIPPVDPDFQLSVLTCAQWGNNNDSGYCNPEYDKLYEAQGVARDRAERQRIVNQMQQIAFDDRPYIALVYQNVIEAHSPKWTGFLMSPLVGSVNNLSTQTLLQVHPTT
ncbi:ABC transporter substrate-binding protein [Mycolicibacterium sarraceniae]|uniref:Peptide ABC transporter substrate-binding protein n=1 Tax=Mycolicibacterium sarraceniae TaxID=1534348 RepID=A0A7I7SR98_9MYCO|nr:peptide ABC transporter substrate-binding protein [Mycolicibacterium sarraceniae]BBY58316.1 peptide ABC transporter substrate-binding protein [Mycolicibacterium sarraceniae]